MVSLDYLNKVDEWRDNRLPDILDNYESGIIIYDGTTEMYFASKEEAKKHMPLAFDNSFIGNNPVVIDIEKEHNVILKKDDYQTLDKKIQ